MKIKLRFIWIGLLIFIGGPNACLDLITSSAWAQGGALNGYADTSAPVITKLKILFVGPQKVSETMVRSNIRVKEGEAFDRVRVDEDVRSLYSTGYFLDVKQSVEQVAPGEVELTYSIEGKPIIQEIFFEGNYRYGDRKLRKTIESKVGDPLTRSRLFADTLAIKEKYQKAGRYKTEVEYAFQQDNARGFATVTFSIIETPKVRIKNINFIGVTAFRKCSIFRRMWHNVIGRGGENCVDLNKVIDTRRWRWYISWLTGSGVLKDEEFEDDAEKLREFFRNEGYIDFQIEDTEFVYLNKKRMFINFILSEGQQYRVGSVEFRGNELYSSEELINLVIPKISGRPSRLLLKPGNVFSPAKLKDDIETIKDYYGGRGYIDTQVVPIKTPNVTEGSIDLVYEITESSPSFVEEIEIRGNEKTKDKVIRRELSIYPGEQFDSVRVKLSKRRLEGMNYFSKVDTRPTPTAFKSTVEFDGVDHVSKNLVIGVEEKNTGNATMGVGFSTLDNLVGFVEFSQGNFDLFRWRPPLFQGAGQKFRARVQVGTRRQDYLMSFIEPWFLGRKLQFGLDLFHRNLGFVSSVYDETRTGGRISLSKPLWNDFIIGTVSYTLESIGIVDVAQNASQIIKDEAGKRLVSRVGVSIAYDTRNSATLPNRGTRTELRTEVAGGPFGGDSDFYRLEARSAWYFPGLVEGHVLEVIGRTGVVEEYGDSTRVPLFDRWYLGGIYNLRGYDFRDVSPRDPRTLDPIGGNTYYYGSAEYSVPLIEMLRLAAFYDIGNVYLDPYDYSDISTYNDNWGIGLRLNLPIGPLRLDYAIPITYDQYQDGRGRFQFSVSYTRD